MNSLSPLSDPRSTEDLLLVVSNALVDFLDLFFIKMMGDQPDDHVNEGEFDNEWEVKSESCWKPASQGS